MLWLWLTAPFKKLVLWTWSPLTFTQNVDLTIDIGFDLLEKNETGVTIFFLRIILDTLIPKEIFNGNYYYYTMVEPCSKTGSTFIVFEETVSISENQLNTLRLELFLR